MPEGSPTRQLATALALVAFLAGCSSAEQRPQALPSVKTPVASALPATSATSATSATITQDATAESVREFVRSYFDEINRAITIGNVSRLSAYSIPACPCRRLVNSIRAKWTNSSLRGGKFTVRSITTHDVTPTLAGAEVLFDVARAEVVNPDGLVIETIKAAPRATDDLSMVRYHGHWLVANVFELN